MNLRLVPCGFLSLLCLLLPATAAQPAARTYNFPIYKNNPSGKQLTGQFAPASTPALSPEESRKKFVVPPGFEVRLFAAEPEVVNPVAMTWDERGRLWVVELYEYPLGAKPGQNPRDRIKVLEDTDGDGRADKVNVFADGFNLATGIQLGNGGVYLGQAPNLYFLQDTNGDDVPCVRHVVAVGVLEKVKIRRLAKIDTPVAELNSRGQIKPVGEHAHFVGAAVAVGVFEYLDAVARRTAAPQIPAARRIFSAIPPATKRACWPARIGRRFVFRPGCSCRWENYRFWRPAERPWPRRGSAGRGNCKRSGEDS